MVGKTAQNKLEKVKQRRAVTLVFGLTLLFSGLVAFKNDWRQFWQRLSEPVVISDLPQEARFDPRPVVDQIKAVTTPLLGVYGVYVENLVSGHQYGLFQKQTFPMASLVKLPVILTLYQEAEADRLNLEDEYPLREADKLGGAGILQSQPAGSVYTYRQLAQLMGHYSDNTAYNVALKVLGLAKVQRTIEQLGMASTALADFETTPADMGLFFRRLYAGKLVNNLHQQEIFEFLTTTVFEDRIPAGVPEGVRVVHKVGTEIGNFADAGIVMAPQPFVLVIITQDARESEALTALPEISRLVWEFETTALP